MAQSWPEEIVPLVSIACTTHNHERFVPEALDSLLAQETTFPVEILVHDDASTDATADIVREYAARYPGLFRPLFQRENQYSRGLKPNVNFNYPRVRGSYVAFCEGDDYWTEPSKLERQVAYLDAHPDCILCCHNAWDLYEDGTRLDYVGSHRPEGGVITYRDLVGVNFIPTASVVLRREAVAEMPREIHAAQGGDWVLWAHLTRLGELRYMDFHGSVRRRHGGGVFAGRDAASRLKFRIDQAEEVNRMMGGAFREELRVELAEIYDRIVRIRRKEGELGAALRAAWNAWALQRTGWRGRELRALAAQVVRGRLGRWRRRTTGG